MLEPRVETYYVLMLKNLSKKKQLFLTADREDIVEAAERGNILTTSNFLSAERFYKIKMPYSQTLLQNVKRVYPKAEFIQLSVTHKIVG